MRTYHHSRLATLLIAVLVSLVAVAAVACGDDDDDSGEKLGGSMILATTTSTDDSGLLDVLVPLFLEKTGIEVKVIAVGTGAALEMGGKGNADSVLAHAYTAEQEYVKSGDLVEGRLVMHNDFVIAGPASDPAGVRQAGSLEDAMRAIAESGSFVSRGDDSGTHKAELALWKAAGVDVAGIASREETGQGMGATLNVADQRNAYTITDRATYLALKDNLDLEVVFEGARPLLNIYHAYVVNPEKHSNVQAERARAWVEFLVADETQKVIGEFGVDQFGEPLFVPDAGKSLESLGQ